jgi:hypothetical protein
MNPVDPASHSSPAALITYDSSSAMDSSVRSFANQSRVEASVAVLKGCAAKDSSSTGSVKKRQNPAKNCLEAADQQQLSSILRVLLFGLSRAA